MVSRSDLEVLIGKGETRNVEFKQTLTRADLKADRAQRLVTRFRYMTCDPPFEGRLVIGVEDLGGKSWRVRGLTRRGLETAEDVLKTLCEQAGLTVVEREQIETDQGLVGIYVISPADMFEVRQTCSINVAGRVNSGKSTLVGSLVTGRPDNGSGRARSFLLTHPQEIVKGQTADIHLAFMGFTADGSRVHIENPLNRQEAAMALDRSAKIITFFDAPGHQEFSKTMIRSILGSDAQYGMVLIPVPDEAELVLGEESRTGTRRLDDITREHIILMVGRRVPFMILLSMVDRATHEYVELVLGVVRETVKETGRIPVLVRTWDDAQPVLREMPNGAIVPIIPVSAVDMQSLDLLTRILRDLPIDTSSTDVSSPAFAYIDKVYRGVRGTNIVVTGTVKQGVFKRGQMVQIGPDENGQMMEGRLFSIEVFKRRVSAVKVGDLFGFDIKDVDKHRIRRGQVVMDVDGNAPNSVRTIEANIVVTRHPTRIVEGYTPVLQCHTIQQPVVLKKIYDRDYLAVGDFARVRLEFMLRPEIVNVNDKIVLREANTRAIGTVVEIVR